MIFNRFGFSRTTLKVLALIFMTIDHVGYMLISYNINSVGPIDTMIFRYIGRLAMPLFAYMIAEGAYYTKNRLKYFLQIFILGLICLVVYAIADHQIYICILLTFSFSIGLIYAYDYIKANYNNKKIIFGIIAFLLVLSMAILCSYPPADLVRKTRWYLDYGMSGVLIPVFTYIGFKNKWMRFGLFSLSVLLSSLYLQFIECNGMVQLYSLFSIVVIFFYTGKKSKITLKYFFYLYYPLHLVFLNFLFMLIFGH